MCSYNSQNCISLEDSKETSFLLCKILLVVGRGSVRYFEELYIAVLYRLEMMVVVDQIVVHNFQSNGGCHYHGKTWRRGNWSVFTQGYVAIVTDDNFP